MKVTYITDQVLDAVKKERERQFKKFGDTPDTTKLAYGTDCEKLAILTEEHGEVGKEVCEGELFGNDTDFNLYVELVQVAAVATAFAETLVRDKRVRLAEAYAGSN